MKLCRAILRLAVLIFVSDIGLACIKTAWGAVLAIIALFALAAKKRQENLDAFGTARWASVDDLERAKMLRPGSGLILGRVVRSRPGFLQSLRELFRKHVPAAIACEQFVFSMRKLQPKKPDTALVRLNNAVHIAVIAPTGAGKGVSCVIPHLLSCPDSCVVVDFKGENAMKTAEHRAKQFGHKIVILDPFNVVTKTPDTFNLMDTIDAESPFMIDECRALANAMVIRTGEEKDPFWNDSGELWITAMLVAASLYGKDGHRSLQTVRTLLTVPSAREGIIQHMCVETKHEGMVARLGNQLTNYKDKELGSVLSTANRFMNFLDTVAVASNTKASSFKLSDLGNGKTTVYMVLPPKQISTQAGLLRLWVGAMLRAVVDGGLQEQTKVHFILDEAASLGRMDCLDDAVDKYRGYGVRLQFFYQSMGQLRKCWGEGGDQTLLSNTTQVYFGVNDPQTAEYVSNRLGEATIVVDSGGTNTGWNKQTGDDGKSSYSSSGGGSRSWAQQARKLLKPEEVVGLDKDIAITFAPGIPPLWTKLINYRNEPPPQTRWWEPKRANPWKLAMRKAEQYLTAVLLLGLGLTLLWCVATL